MVLDLYMVRGFVEKGYREMYLHAKSEEEAKKVFKERHPGDYTFVCASKTDVAITGYTMNLEQLVEVEK